jgi:hypothetical protein
MREEAVRRGSNSQMCEGFPPGDLWLDGGCGRLRGGVHCRAGELGVGFGQAARPQAADQRQAIAAHAVRGPDRYNPITVSKLHVVARWTGNLTGAGYRIQISTTEPAQKIWRTCKTGTSCPVSQAVPIRKGQEFSWTVRIVRVKTHLYQVVGGFMVCLVRNAHPS